MYFKTVLLFQSAFKNFIFIKDFCLWSFLEQYYVKDYVWFSFDLALF